LSEAAHWLVARRKRYPAEQQRVLVMTDGRLKAIDGLAQLACPGLLVDIERGPIRLGRAQELAAGLQLEYRHIDQL
jgi:magnesium chelatase subunit ChlD-like protein